MNICNKKKCKQNSNQYQNRLLTFKMFVYSLKNPLTCLFLLYKCIAINDKWSKGHVRLASSYIALDSSIIGNNNNDSTATTNTTTNGKQNQRTHSNDACNSLQRALSLDPSNRTARQMLTYELKARDNSNASNVSSATNGGARTSVNDGYNHGNVSPEPSAPPVTDSTSYSSSTPLSSSTPFTTTSTGNNNNNNNDDLDIDTSSPYESWEGRFHFKWSRMLSWYESLSEDIRTLVKVLLGLVLLYVAFGGRFGLGYVRNGITDAVKDRAARYDYGNSNGKGCIQGGAGGVGGRGGSCENTYGSKGNYGVGNAYDQYWERKNKGRYQHSTYHDNSQRQEQQWSHDDSNYDDDEIVDTNDASTDTSYGSYQEAKEDSNTYNDDNDSHNTQRSHNDNAHDYHHSSEHYTNPQQQQKQQRYHSQQRGQQQRHREHHHSNHKQQHYQSSHHQPHQHHSNQQQDNVMMIYQYVVLVMLLVGTFFSVIFRSNNGMPRPVHVDSMAGEAAGEAGLGGVGTTGANTSTRSTGGDDSARNNDNMMNEGYMGNVRRGVRMGLGLGMGIGMRRMGMRRMGGMGMGGMGMGMGGMGGMGMGGMGMGGMGGFGRMGLFRRFMMFNRAMQMNDAGRGGGGYNARRRNNRWW